MFNRAISSLLLCMRGTLFQDDRFAGMTGLRMHPNLISFGGNPKPAFGSRHVPISDQLFHCELLMGEFAGLDLMRPLMGTGHMIALNGSDFTMQISGRGMIRANPVPCFIAAKSAVDHNSLKDAFPIEDGTFDLINADFTILCTEQVRAWPL